MKIILIIAILTFSATQIEAQKNPGMLYKIADPAITNPAITNPSELSSFKGMNRNLDEQFMDIMPECHQPPKYTVWCFASYSQCIGIFNQSGLRQYDYQNFYMIVDIVFNKKPKKIKLNGTVDITVDAGQNPLHVYFQDIVWDYEGNFGVWQPLSQSGLGFTNKTFQSKSRWVNGSKEYYIRLRFSPKNVYIGNFNSLGGIPSGKYGFELQPRFTFVTLT